jgi:glycyl-tRNA synthetase
MWLPPKKLTSEVSEKSAVLGKTEALASISLFSQPPGEKNEAYQRITRVSRVTTGQQESVVAVASALAIENEIVVLKAISEPTAAEKLVSIKLGKAEAADIDFVSNSDTGSQTMAYCTDDKVFLQQFSSISGSMKSPIEIYETSQSAAGVKSADRPKFRSIRYLTPRHLLLLQNMPKRSGADLLILRVNEDGTQGQVRLQKRLSKSTKSAVGLDVCLLSESQAGEKQIIIAVAGQNSTVELMTLEFSPVKGIDAFRPFGVLRDVHSGPITKLCFSKYVPPTMPVTSDVRPQYVKLASVGVDQTVVVHTFPLRPFPPTHSRTPRYVLVPPGRSEALQTTFSVFMAIFVIGFVAFLLQVFSEIRGAVPPMLGARDWLGPRGKDIMAKPYIFAPGPVLLSEIPAVSDVAAKVKGIASDLPRVEAVSEKLQDIIQQQSEEGSDKVIVMRDIEGDLATELHREADVVGASTVKRWEELTEHEKKGWKQRLSDTGHWSTSHGESVLKGIFFSELAGVVREVVRGA